MVSLTPLADDQEYALETRDASPSHLLTKIKSFSLLSKQKIAELESVKFEAGDYKWKVKINVDGGQQISVKLCMVSSLPAGWEVNAIFNFFLYNHISDKYLCFRGKAWRFHAVNSERGFSNLISKKSLTEPSNGYLFKDMCVFGAEVFVIKKQPLVEEVSVHVLSTPYKRKWEISEFFKLETIWKSEKFSVGGHKWCFMIYPNGNASNRGLYVSVFLECVDAKSFGDDKKVNAACLFCFKNKFSDKNDFSREVIHWFTPTSPNWGFAQFIAISDTRDPSKGFVVDDCCTFEIQMTVKALHNVPCVAGL